jgi:hypothetical protein
MDEAVKNMIENLAKNTGKSLEEWLPIVQQSAFSKHGELVNFLKKEYNIGHGFANMIVHKAKGSDAGSAENADDLISKQYEGKESLKAIYAHLISAIYAFGPDVEFSPKNAYVSVRRKKQFALIQPSTKTRLDIGINLKNVEPTDKLEKSGSFNAMCSHRVRIEHIGDVDSNVIDWLKIAYDNAG